MARFVSSRTGEAGSTQRQLRAVLLVYLLLALAYGVVNPLFEAPDEHWHYFTAQTISETGRLPSVAEEADPWTMQEAAQPPLYYLLASGVIGLFDTDQAREMVWPNPRVRLGDAASPTNINAFVHTEIEAWPWWGEGAAGYVLVAHLLRALSALIGLGTLICIYGAARLVWPAAPDRAVLATAVVAFLPQFAFLHSAISNDPLVILLASAALWQLLRLWHGSVDARRLVWLGLTIGLAILTKAAGLLLLVYALAFLLVLAWRRRGGWSAAVAREWLAWSVLVVGPALLLAGWLLWRNWRLYGDPTATNQFIRLAGGDRQYSLPEVLAETSGLWTSLYAIFGWFNVRAPQWVYLVWNGLAVLAVAGAARPDRGRGQSVSAGEGSRLSAALLPGLLAVWVLLVYAGLVRFMLFTPAAQGRLLFPAIVPLALALAYGLSRLPWPGIKWLAPILALATSVTSVAVVIPRAYALPARIQADHIPAAATSLDAELGQGMRLLAAQVETAEALPDEWVWAQLYWTADPIPPGAGDLEGPEYVLEVLGRDSAVIGKLQSYHGGGLYPASLWQPGEVVADRVAVRLDEALEAPTLGRLNVKLVGNEQVSVDVGAVKVAPERWPAAADVALADLEGVWLTESRLDAAEVTPGQTVTVRLRWQVNRAPGRDLATFVHLGDPAEPPLAQGDGLPLDGDYPTRLWATGEVIADEYRLTIPADLPPGRYPVQVGLYDPQNGQRVPLTVDGQRQAHDAYRVGWLER